MYVLFTVANPQSMVLMKNSANAFAPSGVCWVASSGMIGGFSPRLVFGPVVGTSAGRLGWGGSGGPLCEDVTAGDDGPDDTDDDDTDDDRPDDTDGDDTDGEDTDGDDVGVPPLEDVQPAHASTADAAAAQIHRTIRNDAASPHVRHQETATTCGKRAAGQTEQVSQRDPALTPGIISRCEPA